MSFVLRSCLIVVRRILIAIICVTVSLTGCTTLRPVNPTNDKSIVGSLAPNDSVRVWMRDGRVIDLRLTAVEPDALIGEKQRLPIQEIQRVERREFSATRTTLLVVGIGVATFLGLAIYASHHVGGGW
jgi:hypothetical protein